MKQEIYMKLAVNSISVNTDNNFKTGGPFGAVIVKNGVVVATSRNKVLENNDPTAHAEIMAIRSACEKLGTHDLTGCELYTTCYPCPMCLSAIVWSNIDTVYYGNTKFDAEEIGFRDSMIYDYLKDPENSDLIKMEQLGRDMTIKTFNEFKECEAKEIY